jgi:hypothetical protein
MQHKPAFRRLAKAFEHEPGAVMGDPVEIGSLFIEKQDHLIDPSARQPDSGDSYERLLKSSLRTAADQHAALYARSGWGPGFAAMQASMVLDGRDFAEEILGVFREDGID